MRHHCRHDAAVSPPTLLRQPTFFTALSLPISMFIHNLSLTTCLDYPENFHSTLKLGVGESEEIQLFYYFIESERSPEKDPLLIWLQGGPGCSGFSGLVFENGPLIFDYANYDGNIPSLLINPYSWTKVANIIFLDQPVGAGFSYSETSEGYRTSDSLSAKQTYEFLKKWLVNHPNFLKNPLYMAGESYCGIVLPLVVNEIYNGIKAGDEPHMNMKSARKNCNGNYLSVEPNNFPCKNDLKRVNQCIEKIWLYHILEPWCDMHNVNQDLLMHHMPYSSYEEINARRSLKSLLYDRKGWCRPMNYMFSNYWANVKLVQEALHVREGMITEWVRCNRTLSKTTYTKDVNSTVIYHKKFSDESNYRAMILSGDHDMGAPHSATEEWIRSLELQIQSDWRPWFVEGQIAGYTIEYFNGESKLTLLAIGSYGEHDLKRKQVINKQRKHKSIPVFWIGVEDEYLRRTTSCSSTVLP